MDWQETEKQLRAQPLPKGRSPEEFWAEFGRRTADLPRDVEVHEPIPFRHWALLAAAAVAVLAGVALFVPGTDPTPIQVASTEVKSVDVVASHAGVIIMNQQAEGTDEGGTILWITGLDLDASEGK